MRNLMILLPLAAILLKWRWYVVGRPALGWQRNGLRAAVLSGAWMVLVTEGLSLVHGLTPVAVGLAWALPAAADAARLVRGRHGLLPRSWLPGLRTAGVWDRSILAAVLLILFLTGVVAWATPPQTWDSLNYHMSRVAHWAENASGEPFATGIETQNSRPPGAEFAVLQVYLLAGSDRWVNFVAWGAVAGTLVAAYVLARQVGGGRDGRILAVVYVATLPMGIIQASSTMTDAVVAFWVAVAATEVMGFPEDGPSSGGVMWGGLAAGMAVLTKPTALPFLAPLAVWAFVRGVRHQGWRRTLSAGVLAAMLVSAINAGHWTRSYLLYGDPISGGDQLDVHANQALGLDGQISNVLRNAALHLGTPSPHVNRAIALAILEVHHLLGISPDDPRTTAHGHFKVDTPNTRENTAGNPAQAYLGLVGLAAVFLRRDSSKTLKGLALTALAGFWIFSTLFKWQIFGSRYHLAFFVLLAPAVAVALARLVGPPRSRWIAAALLASSLPWLLSIRSRPLVPIPGDSLVGSVLAETRPRLMLANGPYLLTPYQEMADRIQDSACRQIGLALGGNSAEYPLWVFLGFPRTDRHIEWLVAGTPSASLTPASFTPCAVICEGCARDDLFRGLPRAYARAGFVLFLTARDG